MMIMLKIPFAVVSEPYYDKGFFGGGQISAFQNIIDYIDYTTTSGNAIDKGDLTSIKCKTGGVHATTYGYFYGGWTGSARVTTIDYINRLTTSGNALNRGNIGTNTSVQPGWSGVQGANYGFFTDLTTIDYLDLTTNTGNGAYSGANTSKRLAGSISGPTNGYWGGGEATPTTMTYINMSTTGTNYTSKGSLTFGRYLLCGVGGDTYGFFCGGYGTEPVNIIDYINDTTGSGNAVDTGNLTVVRTSSGASSGPLYGFIAGGANSGLTVKYSSIDYVELSVNLQNALNKGNLTVGRMLLTGF